MVYFTVATSLGADNLDRIVESDTCIPLVQSAGSGSERDVCQTLLFKAFADQSVSVFSCPKRRNTFNEQAVMTLLMELDRITVDDDGCVTVFDGAFDLHCY